MLVRWENYPSAKFAGTSDRLTKITKFSRGRLDPIKLTTRVGQLAGLAEKEIPIWSSCSHVIELVRFHGANHDAFFGSRQRINAKNSADL